MGQRGAVERVDHGPVGGLERQMMAAGQPALRGGAVGAGDEQLVGPEVVLALAAERHAEHVEDRAVEAARCGQVAYDQLDVVDQAATVQFLGFHRFAPVSGGWDLHDGSARLDRR